MSEKTDDQVYDIFLKAYMSAKIDRPYDSQMFEELVPGSSGSGSRFVAHTGRSLAAMALGIEYGKSTGGPIAKTELLAAVASLTAGKQA